RCIKDSALGRFTSNPEESRHAAPTTPGPQRNSHITNNNNESPTQPERTLVDTPEAEPASMGCSAFPAITQLGEAVGDIRQLMNESKGVLENMNRVLVALQRNQFTTGEWDNHNLVHVNPVNDQGLTASECGLPQLRFTYHKGKYWNHLDANGLAGYLKFFGIGAHLFEEGERPRLKSGREPEARERILKHI
ncbi:hypothetical protein FRC11_014673, partial [Ceratobasidium sp. 423]